MSNDDLKWFEDHPEMSHIMGAYVDLNGVMRGKRLPAHQAAKVLGGKVRMPPSSIQSDIWGQDVEANPIADDTGDADGICMPTGRGVVPVTWKKKPYGLVPLWITDEKGEPFVGDPRGALYRVLKKYQERGLTPVVATELEFYLYELEDGLPVAPKSPVTGRRFDNSQTLSLDEMDDLEDFFNDVYDACEAQGIPADTMVSENGAGQYEVNLLHSNDPLRMADDTVLFKRLVRGIAQKYGMGATFMAKPFGEQGGSSMHVHFSVLDSEGRNIFDNGTDEGAPVLKHAVGGLLEGLSELTLIYAPHFNSYRRMRPETLAPMHKTWGYENRTAAVRIPGGPTSAKRIEQRVGGADANPYLVLAATLGAALVGMDKELDPGQPLEGWTYCDSLPLIPMEWGEAIAAFEKGKMVEEIFDPYFKQMILNQKKHEFDVFKGHVSAFEYQTYLDI